MYTKHVFSYMEIFRPCTERCNFAPHSLLISTERTQQRVLYVLLHVDFQIGFSDWSYDLFLSHLWTTGESADEDLEIFAISTTIHLEGSYRSTVSRTSRVYIPCCFCYLIFIRFANRLRDFPVFTRFLVRIRFFWAFILPPVFTTTIVGIVLYERTLTSLKISNPIYKVSYIHLNPPAVIPYLHALHIWDWFIHVFLIASLWLGNLLISIQFIVNCTIFSDRFFAKAMKLWVIHKTLYACFMFSLLVHHSKFSSLLSVLIPFLWFTSSQFLYHSNAIITSLWMNRSFVILFFVRVTFEYHLWLICGVRYVSILNEYTSHSEFTLYNHSYHTTSFQVSDFIKFIVKI